MADRIWQDSCHRWGLSRWLECGARLEAYRAAGGYAILQSLASRSPESVIRRLRQVGLRGRGGGGFPAGWKWEMVRAAPDPVRFVVANGAEGEPGSEKDRFLLTHLPHRILEGVWMVAWVVQAQKIFVGINEAFPEAREAVLRALDEVQGSDLARGPASTPVEVVSLPHHYLAGEETALLEALEGRPPVPRGRPPYPTEKGLGGHPTLIHNVETLAWVPEMLREEGEILEAYWCTLSGDVCRPGVYEIPRGVPLSEVVRVWGRGLPAGQTLKALFPAGPSGGVLTPEEAATPLDPEALQSVGSRLGAGCLRVVGSGTSLLEVALEYARFFRDASCGQCTPCVSGLQSLVAALEQQAQGRSSGSGIEGLLRSCRFMKTRARCGLPVGASECLGSLFQKFPETFGGWTG